MARKYFIFNWKNPWADRDGRKWRKKDRSFITWTYIRLKPCQLPYNHSKSWGLGCITLGFYFYSVGSGGSLLSVTATRTLRSNFICLLHRGALGRSPAGDSGAKEEGKPSVWQQQSTQKASAAGLRLGIGCIRLPNTLQRGSWETWPLGCYQICFKFYFAVFPKFKTSKEDSIHK